MTDPTPQTLYVPTLQDRPIPERQWIVEDWIPKSYVTGLSGDGGIGKTLLGQQLLTCVAAGLSFLGVKTAQMKVLGVFCEDNDDELHRRQANINSYYNIEWGDLEYMQWQSWVGCDNVLMEFLRDNVGTPTAAYEALRKEVKKTWRTIYSYRHSRRYFWRQ